MTIWSYYSQLDTTLQFVTREFVKCYFLLRTGIPTGQPTWDPFESGGLIPYRAPLGRNEGNICEKCGQDLGPIWGIHMLPI